VTGANVRDLLPRITIPTLVLHCRGDRLVPFEMGCELAALIPGARFVALESNNHLILEHEPATEVFFNEVAAFLGDPKPKSWKRAVRASEARLQLIARGVEASATYKMLTVVTVIATLVTFVAWLVS
jgi:hypothetical protein